MHEITCHYCFETIPLEIFLEDGKNQSFVIDCEVCCHPMEIKASWDEEGESFQIDVGAGLG